MDSRTLSYLLAVIFATYVLSGSAIIFLSHVQERPAMEITYYAEPLPEYAPNYYANAVNDAINYWSARDNFIFIEKPESEAQIKIFWAKELRTLELGETALSNDKADVRVSLGDSTVGEWKIFEYSLVSQIMKHEIGHAIGKSHSTNPFDVMHRTSYFAGNIGGNRVLLNLPDPYVITQNLYFLKVFQISF